MSPLSHFSPLRHKKEQHSRGKTSSPFRPIGILQLPPTATQKHDTSAPAVDPTEARMKQLEKMLKEAQSKAESAEREAYAKAYALGEEAGMELGQKRAEQMLSEIEKLLTDVEQHVADLQSTFSEVVITTATAMAEHVIDNLNESYHSMLLTTAERAARQLPDLTELKLAVSPDSIEIFNQLLKEKKSDWKLVTDRNLHPHACRIISLHQDIMIHPLSALHAYEQRVRDELLKPVDTSEASV